MVARVVAGLMQVGGLQIGTEAVILVVVGAVCLALATATCVPLLRDRRVPSGVLLAGLGLFAAAVPALAWLARPQPGMPLDHVRLAMTTVGAVGIVAPLGLGAIAAAQSVFLAIPILHAKQRAWLPAVLVLLVGATALALEASGGALHHNGFFAALRAAGIAVGVLACAALTLGVREPAGADGAAAASVGLVLLAAAVQGMLPGVASILVQKPLLAVLPDVRVAGVGRFLEPLAVERPWQWGALAVLTLGAFGVCALASRVRRSALSALPWLAVAAWIAWAAGPNAEALRILATSSLR